MGLLLRGVKRDDIRRGQLVVKPGTMSTYTSFEAEIYVLTQQEGGRHTPFFTHYRCGSNAARQPQLIVQCSVCCICDADVFLFYPPHICKAVLTVYLLAAFFVCRPQFFFRTSDVTGDIILPEEVEMVVPGERREEGESVVVLCVLGCCFAVCGLAACNSDISDSQTCCWSWRLIACVYVYSLLPDSLMSVSAHLCWWCL